MTNVTWLQEDTRAKLKQIGNMGESYNTVINRLIEEYKRKRKESEKQCVIKK